MILSYSQKYVNSNNKNKNNQMILNSTIKVTTALYSHSHSSLAQLYSKKNNIPNFFGLVYF